MKPTTVAMTTLLLFIAMKSTDGQTFSYDPAGQLSKAVYSNGTLIKYKYDVAGNLKKAVVNAAVIAAISADESNHDAIRVEVKRTGDMSKSLTITLSADGDAVSGQDYLDLPSNVTIPAHESSASFSVKLRSDRPTSPAKKLVLNLAESDDYELDEHFSATIMLPAKK